MWRNYVTVGLRALAKSWTYTFINIFGLAVGLAACLMILLYIRYETSYDAWLPDADRVFQVQMFGDHPATGEPFAMQASPGPMSEALAKDFPQFEAVSRMESGRPVFVKDGEAVQTEGLELVDEPFFDILQIPFLRGDRATALKSMENLVLSRSEAIRIFGSIDVVGRMLTRVREGEKRDFRITGVFEDLPKNSHLGFTMIGRYNPAEEPTCPWMCVNGGTYVKLKPGVDVQAINSQMAAFEKRNITPENIGGVMTSAGDKIDFRLTNVRDVHLGEAQDGSERPGNDKRTIVTFAIVALLILLMAVVNFINLSTARASQRAREVAVRKVVGASRKQLILQFMAESVLITLLAMFTALAVVELSLPALGAFLDARLEMTYLGEAGILLPALGLVLAVGLAAGLYPAFFLSRFQPASVLKANKSSSETAGSGRLRNALVVAQFAISIGLIVCTAVVYNQTVYARTSDPGYQREGLLIVEGMLRPEVAPVRETFVREIAKIDGVSGMSGSMIVPGSDQTFFVYVNKPGQAPEKVGWYSIEPDFFETLKIRMLAGRRLSAAYANDRAHIDYANLETEEQVQAVQSDTLKRGMNIVVNEHAAKRLGFRSAASAVGKQISLNPYFDERSTSATIVGVAANSRFRSLRDPLEPIIFHDDGRYWRQVIRFEGASGQAVREQVARAWKRLLPDVPFEADFADQKLAAFYDVDAKRGQSFAGFAGLAAVIACLGLFGLAAFTAERRTKEIGIRKVFGARIRDIVQLLAWQFSKPVVVANLLAWPAAWWVMRDWLNTFDARIDLGPGPFVVAGLLALVIALGTVAGHSIKVARMNPVHALRYE